MHTLNKNEQLVLKACYNSYSFNDDSFGYVEEVLGTRFENCKPESLTVNQLKGYLSQLQSKGLITIYATEMSDHGFTVTQFLINEDKE
jgi:hypothetical protein